MKILVFSSLYPNNVWANHGVFVKERISAVSRLNGCDVTVIAPVPYHPPIRVGKRWGHSQVTRQEVIDGIPVYHPRYFMIPKISMPFHGAMMFLSVLRFVRKIQKQFDFDIIDAHYVYPDGFAAALLGRFFHKPVVVTARGSDINVFAHLRFIRWLLRYTLNSVDGVIAVSEALKRGIVGLGIPESKIAVVPNGVDPKKFHPLDKSEARETLGLPEDKKLLLSVGGLESVKGFDHLIGALKILIQEFRETDIFLVIVGEGELRSKLLRMIAERSLDAHVRLVGAVPHDQLRLWYSAADLFCLASRNEGWPNVINEALACGTPVVATAVGGIPEIIRSETLGLLTESDDGRLAEKIRQALGRAWKRGEIACYMEQHSWDNTARSVVRNFETALNGDARLS
jgi:teichuronic acid biosynthesis glycosyltransferase TuaC